MVIVFCARRFCSDFAQILLVSIQRILLTPSFSYCYRDEPHEGRAVKRMDFPCQAGSVEWTGPYGGLFINIQGPKKDHQLCLQASAYHSSGVVSILDESENPRQLVKLVETRDTERPIRHTVCLSAHGDTLLFVEADIDALVSSKIIVEYDVETNPRYGDDGKSNY